MDKYFVLKNDDIDQYLSPNYKKVLGLICRRIERQRILAGKTPKNDYLVINKDEIFIGQMYDVMKESGVKIV